MSKPIHAVPLLCIALAGLAGCGGSSSNDKGLNIYLQVDEGVTKYSSGSKIDLGAFSTEDAGFTQEAHTFTLVNDSGETIALDGIEFVSGSLDDGNTKVTTTYDYIFGDFWITNQGPLTDAEFAPDDSAAFTVTFQNFSMYVEGRDNALWNARKRYRINVTDANDKPADFVFEVYGVASC